MTANERDEAADLQKVERFFGGPRNYRSLGCEIAPRVHPDLIKDAEAIAQSLPHYILALQSERKAREQCHELLRSIHDALRLSKGYELEECDLVRHAVSSIRAALTPPLTPSAKGPHDEQ